MCKIDQIWNTEVKICNKSSYNLYDLYFLLSLDFQLVTSDSFTSLLLTGKLEQLWHTKVVKDRISVDLKVHQAQVSPFWSCDK